MSKHATDATTDRKPLPSPPLLADPQTTFATLSLLKVDRTPILNPLTLPVLGKTTTTMPRALQQAINNEAVKEQDQQDRLTNPPYSLTLLKKPHPGSPSPAKRQPPHTTHRTPTTHSHMRMPKIHTYGSRDVHSHRCLIGGGANALGASMEGQLVPRIGSS